MNRKTTHTAVVGLLIAVALIAGIGATVSPVAAQESGELAVGEGNISVPQGEERTVTITYDGTVEPTGFDYELTYDPDIITVRDHSTGDYFNPDFTQPESGNGRTGLTGLYTGDGSADGTNGTVGEITISPARGAEEGDTTNIQFDNDQTSGSYDDGEINSISLTTTDGTVQVEAGVTIEDRVAELTGSSDALEFEDLTTAIERYQNNESVDGTELTFDDLVYVIEQYHEE